MGGIALVGLRLRCQIILGVAVSGGRCTGFNIY